LAILVLGLTQFSNDPRHGALRLHRWIVNTLVAAGVWFAKSALWIDSAQASCPNSLVPDAAWEEVALMVLTVLYSPCRWHLHDPDRARCGLTHRDGPGLCNHLGYRPRNRHPCAFVGVVRHPTGIIVDIACISG
jgi:hypothetical protein